MSTDKTAVKGKDYKTIDFTTTVGPTPAGKEVVLSIRNLAISFKTDRGKVQAVRGVSFDLYKGETLCIVGESGSGKSVTSKTIMGILPKTARIDSGSVLYEGEDLTKISEEEFHRVRGDKIGMIFQDPLSSLNPIMKIGKQITEVMILDGNHLKKKFDDYVQKELIALKNDERLLELAKSEYLDKKKDLKKDQKAEAEALKKSFDIKKDAILVSIKKDRLAFNSKKKEAHKKVNEYHKSILTKHLREVKDILKENLGKKFDPVLCFKKIVKARREYLSLIKVTEKEAEARALKIMEEVGIPDPKRRFKQYPFEFSGGMRQRIVIAIALTANPDVLICDEPTTALDVTIQAHILELINSLKESRHMSVIFITHDLGVVANMADRVAVMYAGKIVEYGTANDVFYSPAHPYTWALLSSIPDIDSKEKLEAIPGTPPNMIYPPVGDAFALRSKYALGIDFKKEPAMYQISPTHYAATWLLDERAPKAVMPKIVSSRINNCLRKAGVIHE